MCSFISYNRSASKLWYTDTFDPFHIQEEGHYLFCPASRYAGDGTDCSVCLLFVPFRIRDNGGTRGKLSLVRHDCCCCSVGAVPDIGCGVVDGIVRT